MKPSSLSRSWPPRRAGQKGLPLLRFTLGTAYAFARGLRIKFSTDLWEFSDRDARTGRQTELSMHAALAGSF